MCKCSRGSADAVRPGDAGDDRHAQRHGECECDGECNESEASSRGVGSIYDAEQSEASAAEDEESVPRRPGKWRADGSRGAGVGEFDIWMVPDFAQTELKCDSGSGATPAWRGRVAPGPRGGGEWRPHPVAAPLVKAMMVMSVTATIAMMVMMVVAMAVMAAMCTMRRRRPSRSVMAWARTVACARGSTS